MGYSPTIAQNITITIDSSAFKGVDKSALIISDEKGKVLYEYIFIEEELSQGKTFNYFLEFPEKKHHVTLFNHKNGYSWVRPTKARTFYNIKSDLEITEPFTGLTLVEHKPRKLQINGIQEVHHIFTHTKFNSNSVDVHLNSKKDLLKIKHEHPLDADFYMLLHGNNENTPRYIYTPKDEIVNEVRLDWIGVGYQLI